MHGHSTDNNDPERRVTYFAATHTRGKREMFGIRAIDRGKHIYVIGKTGMGKSTLLENLAIQDIQNGEGIAFIDPHGSTAEKLLDFVPHERIKDVVYFAPFDTEHPVGFNVMEDVGFDQRHLVVSGLMGALKRIWVDAWSARMEYILQNTMLALLEYPDSTLLDVNKMLTNKMFRAAVVEKVSDPIVRAFWTEEFAQFTDSYAREATPAIQNKVGQFTSNPLIRNIVGQAKSSFDLRKLMDEKKIFIVNLSKGRMGETNAALLGSMLTVKIYLAAMSRADEPASVMARLPRCYFYVDEFQSMMNEAFADILSESRKYKLALTLANQYIEQMEEEVRDAVFGNVGTLICFRVGPFDAEVLETVFEPKFTPEDLIGLGIGQIYLTLMIDGVGSPPFSAETIPPIEPPRISFREDVISHSREQFGRARSDVEAAIMQKQLDFSQPVKKPQSPRPPEVRSGFSPRPMSSGGGDRRPAEQSSPTRTYQTPPAPYVPRPAPTEPRNVASAPPPPRSPAPEDPKNSLRAAIEAARQRPAAPVSAPSSAPAFAHVPPSANREEHLPKKSPAEILRERQQSQRKDTPQRPHHANPQQKPKESAPPEWRVHNEPHEEQGRAASNGVRVERPGEVTKEVLQKVLDRSGDD